MAGETPTPPGRDTAPGDPKRGHEAGGIGRPLLLHTIGFVLAAGLTAASFALLHTPLIYGPGIPVALIALAVAQMGIHLVFFLQITSGPDNVNNLLALAFGTLIVGLVLVGSLWIMAHLDANMMPAGGMAAEMQRGP